MAEPVLQWISCFSEGCDNQQLLLLLAEASVCRGAALIRCDWQALVADSVPLCIFEGHVLAQETTRCCVKRQCPVAMRKAQPWKLAHDVLPKPATATSGSTVLLECLGRCLHFVSMCMYA